MRNLLLIHISVNYYLSLAWFYLQQVIIIHLPFQHHLQHRNDTLNWIQFNSQPIYCNFVIVVIITSSFCSYKELILFFSKIRYAYMSSTCKTCIFIRVFSDKSPQLNIFRKKSPQLIIL